MPKAKSEYEVKELYIDRLDDMGYGYVDLKYYDDLCSKFRKQFCNSALGYCLRTLWQYGCQQV